MLLLASSRATVPWLLTLAILLSFRTICLPVLAVEKSNDLGEDLVESNNVHDTPQRHVPDYDPSDDQTRPLPRYPVPNAAPPPIRPPGSPYTQLPDPGNDENNSTSHLVCRPFGLCEPCPSEFLTEPYCQPFGNRRLMHCVNGTETSPSPPDSHQRNPAQAADDLPQSKQKGETLAWESCGRIPQQERADFFEFVACNVAFVVIALAVVLWRSKVVQSRQARVLAARIGVGGRGRRF
ncbi:hypothetical protein NMY22_g11528 [Coprinellus aureogranulatus]|nr:hypothetical protein NMY22_g11528 [Coprinellus aureogranulatus]